MGWRFATRSANAKHFSNVDPRASATWLAWTITGPSATGSENGICSSIKSTPAGDHGVDDEVTLFEARIPEHDVRHEQDVARFSSLPNVMLKHGTPPPFCR